MREGVNDILLVDWVGIFSSLVLDGAEKMNLQMLV